MTLEVNILLIVIIFTLFTLFMYCYDSEERRKRSKYGIRSYPARPYDFTVNADQTSMPNPNPSNIGFNVTHTAGPSRAPVGAAPGVQPTPYSPPVQPPYNVVESRAFPSPVTTSLRPSAPVQDETLPPTYYEVTGHY